MQAFVIILIVAILWIGLNSYSTKSSQYYDEDWEGYKYNMDTIILVSTVIFIILLALMLLLEKMPNP